MNESGIIKMVHISHVYDSGKQSVQSLSDISLSICKGEFLALTGPSGSGKSTLLHVMGCLLRPKTGTFSLLGQETTKLSKNELAKIRNACFGFVFQNINLLPRTSALQNVRLPHKYAGIRYKDSLLTAKDLLSRFGLKNRMSHAPNELSGGEQQRVAIARALANNPQILLADEPTGNLDSKNSQAIMDLFEELVNDGLTVILVTHDHNLIHRANRVIRLIDSKISFSSQTQIDDMNWND